MQQHPRQQYDKKKKKECAKWFSTLHDTTLFPVPSDFSVYIVCDLFAWRRLAPTHPSMPPLL